jgi:hypothetical protein
MRPNKPRRRWRPNEPNHRSGSSRGGCWRIWRRGRPYRHRYRRLCSCRRRRWRPRKPSTTGLVAPEGSAGGSGEEVDPFVTAPGGYVAAVGGDGDRDKPNHRSGSSRGGCWRIWRRGRPCCHSSRRLCSFRLRRWRPTEPHYRSGSSRGGCRRIWRRGRPLVTAPGGYVAAVGGDGDRANPTTGLVAPEGVLEDLEKR